MKTEEFRSISITQIIQEADLARATFYINYKTKEDIVKSYIHSLAQSFIDSMELVEQPNIYNLALSFFTYWISKRELLFLLIRNELFNLLYIEFYEVLKEFSGRWSLNEIFDIEFNNEYELDLFCNFIASGLWSVLRSWIDNDMKATPNDMAKSFVKFTK